MLHRCRIAKNGRVRLWAKEAEDRIAACDRGELAEILGDEVLASLKFRPTTWKKL
jgi:hypothetical protein